MTLWTAAEAAAATGGRATGDWEANGVSIDTRTLQPGDLFVVFQSGAYGLTASPRGFLSHPQPREILL